MQPVLNVNDIRRTEVALTREGVSVVELMHRAGCAVAQEALELCAQAKRVAVLVGLGNNGGDGWVAAEALVVRGIEVTVICPLDINAITSDLVRQMAQSACKAGVRCVVGPSRDELTELLDNTDVIIDALLGTGFNGTLRAPFDIWIECVNASSSWVVSVDVPSGLSAQTGLRAEQCVVADLTVTMIGLKPGLLADVGRDVCGSIVVAPLAEQTAHLIVEADPVAWRSDLVDYRSVLPHQSAAVDKFSRGSVLAVGGSSTFAGAPLLAARAAARMGAGYVTLAVPASIAPLLSMQAPEIPVVALPEDPDGTISSDAKEVVLHLAERMDAVLVGPGMKHSGGAGHIVSALLNTQTPLVVDADGLNCLARLTNGNLPDFPEITRRHAPLILTPHRKELSRLIGKPDAYVDSLSAQLEAARTILWADGGSNLVIVSKSSATACVSVERAILPKPGPFSLATAGSGDVLAGMMVSALAQHHDEALDLTLLSAYVAEVHGFAGTLAAEHVGSQAVMASDITEALGRAQDAMVKHISAS